jgi:hypothetical protein
MMIINLKLTSIVRCAKITRKYPTKTLGLAAGKGRQATAPADPAAAEENYFYVAGNPSLSTYFRG